MFKPLPLASAIVLHGLLLFFSPSTPSSKEGELTTHHGRAHTVRLKRQSHERKDPRPKVVSHLPGRVQEREVSSDSTNQESLGEELDESGVESPLSEYISEVRASIEREKYYPRQARRLGHQGDLEVLLDINEEGEILEVRILSSTASRLLDRAGLEIFEKIRRFPPFPNDVSVSHIEISIVLNYRMY